MISQRLFERALDLWQRAGHRLPYDVYPDDHLYHPYYDGQDDVRAVSEAGWQAHQWNPPGYRAHAYPVADPAASAKPTWQQCLAYALEVEKQDAIDDLRTWTRQQICDCIFGARDLIDEIHGHQQGRYTPAQYEHRQLARGKYKNVKEAIIAATTLGDAPRKLEQGRAVLTENMDNSAASGPAN